MKAEQIAAVLAAAKRRALLEAADEIPYPDAAAWLRERAAGLTAAGTPQQRPTPAATAADQSHPRPNTHGRG